MTLLLVLALALQQSPHKPKKGLDQASVDKAIDTGVDYLKKLVMDPAWDELERPSLPPGLPRNIPRPPPRPGAKPANRRYCELVLWTLLHAGVAPGEPPFQKLLKTILDDPLWNTYNVALKAMILQKLDAKKYQKEIAACAQFFADTQCANGQWGYAADYKPPNSGDIETSGGIGKPIKIAPKQSAGPPIGDNSNSQYAALGIRACADAHVDVDDPILKRALAWWEGTQQPNGSWTYRSDGPKTDTKVEDPPPAPPNPRERRAPPPPPRGRPAQKPLTEVNGYGSMTLGAIGSIAIYRKLLNKGIQSKQIKKGFDWLGDNFSVKENPNFNTPETRNNFYFYYLYSMERTGDLTSTELFGRHDWYLEGARELLRIQKTDGSWKEPSLAEPEVCATCFAILFLRRATEPLIKTGDEHHSDPKE